MQFVNLSLEFKNACIAQSFSCLSGSRSEP